MATTIHDLARFKAQSRRFAMLTAYDFATAQILDESGVPVILVGDSLGQVALGYDTTLSVTMDEMLHHTRAVARGAGSALIVADMPFGSYQASVSEGVRNAMRFLKEAGAHAVKFEGAHLELAAALTEVGVPVMGHLGLTPQSVHSMGGYRVQAKTAEAAQRLEAEALNLQKAGAFALVLEGIPAAVAARVTAGLDIPTIGIGAGAGCNGQVLVINDLLGISASTPKFVKRYAELHQTIADAVERFQQDVAAGTFPDAEHSYMGGQG